MEYKNLVLVVPENKLDDIKYQLGLKFNIEADRFNSDMDAFQIILSKDCPIKSVRHRPKKFSEEQVKQIQDEYKSSTNMTIYSLAKKYGASQSVISSIVKGTYYKNK